MVVMIELLFQKLTFYTYQNYYMNRNGNVEPKISLVNYFCLISLKIMSSTKNYS